jgi:translation initiation factor IF-1
VSAAAAAIRTAIVTNSNTGDKVAASLSARVAARRVAARKGKGRFDAKAAAKVEDIVLTYLNFLDVCTTADELREVAEHEHMQLARVTKVVGGSLLTVQLQDGTMGDARIPGHLRARGKVSHKHHKAHVFGTGDVVIVEHGDVKGKFDSPALLAHLESRFRALAFAPPATFFSAAKDAHVAATAASAGEGETWEWDHSADTAALAAKRSAKAGAGGGAAADDDEIDVADI